MCSQIIKSLEGVLHQEIYYGCSGEVTDGVGARQTSYGGGKRVRSGS